MTIQIEWITASLGPSPVQLTLPLNSTKGPDMPTSQARGNQIVLQNSVQPLYCPLFPILLERQAPLQDFLISTLQASREANEGLGEHCDMGRSPIWSGIIIAGNKTQTQMGHCFMSSCFEEVKDLHTTLVVSHCSHLLSSIRFGTQHLHSRHITYYIACYLSLIHI